MPATEQYSWAKRVEQRGDWLSNVARMSWGRGPWANEPDLIAWEFAGLPCVMLRNQFGAWCGYVAVPASHPCHGLGPDDELLVEGLPSHGGITFFGRAEGLCAELGVDDVWFYGFDCGHFWDLMPGLKVAGGAYRDVEYVRAHCEQLAAVLARLGEPVAIGALATTAEKHE